MITIILTCRPRRWLKPLNCPNLKAMKQLTDRSTLYSP